MIQADPSTVSGQAWGTRRVILAFSRLWAFHHFDSASSLPLTGRFPFEDDARQPLVNFVI